MNFFFEFFLFFLFHFQNFYPSQQVNQWISYRIPASAIYEYYQITWSHGLSHNTETSKIVVLCHGTPL